MKVHPLSQLGRQPECISDQAELFGLVWQPLPHPFRLWINDIVRINGKIGRVIRVSDCAAAVLMNRPAREFCTRFERRVRFQPAPVTFRISANSEIEVLNRKIGQQKKRTRKSPPGDRDTGKGFA